MSRRATDALAWLGSVVGPPLLTVVLVPINSQQRRDYVFLYMALVAAVGVMRGFWPALLAAILSFLLVDFFFVPPVGTFTIADEQDIVNLLAFVLTAALVGLLASRRRAALLESEALTRQLRDVNAELVRLNKEQAAAAQAALRLARSEQQVRTLEETDRLRRELLANVSHELRTPLGTILAESTKLHLDGITKEARRLSALVDDMLDMARIEGGALELDLEPIGLGDAVAAAVDRLHHSSPDRVVDNEAQSPEVEVLGDWGRVGQIFDNLLANADRYGPPGTAIEVSAARQEPGLVAVRVRDHGPGIPEAMRERIFERFVRGDTGGDPDATGTGLGLAIVRGLVEAHAGSVAIEDAPDGPGAVVRFTLPEAPAAG